MSESKSPASLSISILIPTRNGEDTLLELLAMLSVQTISIKEVLIIDSSSTDKTVEIAKDNGAAVTVVPKAEFDHGGTRTLISRKASGDLLIFLTQDAIPASKDAIEKLIAPLMTNQNIAVTYGRQLPAFNANDFAAHLRHVNYPPHSNIRDLNNIGKYGFRTIFTSNSFSAYRKSILQEVGYFKNGLIFGEDTCTVGKLLLKGYKIAYVSEARVYHSHNYTWNEEFKRSFDIGVLHTSEKWMLETFGGAEGEGVKYIFSELSSLTKKKKFHLLPAFIVRIGLKFTGYKLGRNYKFIPRWIIVHLSMHKTWWKKTFFIQGK